jgi:hypothetical protein
MEANKIDWLGKLLLRLNTSEQFTIHAGLDWIDAQNLASSANPHARSWHQVDLFFGLPYSLLVPVNIRLYQKWQI